MPITTALLIKYGVPIGKTLWSLYQGDPKGVADLMLKPVEQ